MINKKVGASFGAWTVYRNRRGWEKNEWICVFVGMCAFFVEFNFVVLKGTKIYIHSEIMKKVQYYCVEWWKSNGSTFIQLFGIAYSVVLLFEIFRILSTQLGNDGEKNLN